MLLFIHLTSLSLTLTFILILSDNLSVFFRPIFYPFLFFAVFYQSKVSVYQCYIFTTGHISVTFVSNSVGQFVGVFFQPISHPFLSYHLLSLCSFPSFINPKYDFSIYHSLYLCHHSSFSASLPCLSSFLFF